MDVQKILVELRIERELLTNAIASIERIAAASGRRRGRPPNWLKRAKSDDSNGKAFSARNGPQGKVIAAAVEREATPLTARFNASAGGQNLH